MNKNTVLTLILVTLLSSCAERKANIPANQDYQLENLMPKELQDKVNEAKADHIKKTTTKNNVTCCDHEHEDKNSKTSKKYTNKSKASLNKTKDKVEKPSEVKNVG